MSDTAHQEKHFESYIVSPLVAQGWLVGESAKYDTERAMYLLTAVNERWNLASTSKQQSGVTVLVFPFGTIYCGFNWRPAGLPAGGLRSKVPSGKRSAAGLGSAVWMGR